VRRVAVGYRATMTRSQADRVRSVLDDHGRTFAEEAGITLHDRPKPLFQLLVLSLLASTRISAEVAAAAARELWSCGWRTPHRMLDSTWQERVEALGRGRFRHDGEAAASRLAEMAERVIDEHGGDLRALRPGSAGDVERLRDGLTRFTGIGLLGADVFCREVQAVWPAVRPFFDSRSRAGARSLGLPEDPERLAGLAPDGRVAELAAALVRAG
jgi:endonuclease III